MKRSRFRTARFGLTLLAVIIMLGAARSADTVEQNDDKHAPRPPARSGHMACTDGDLIYITGGSAAAPNAGLRLDVWNPRTDERKQLPAPQHERALGAMVNVGERIYLIGGLDSDGKTINSIEVFNTATAAWEEPINDPAPASRHAAVAIGTTIYIIGGIDATTVHSTQLRSLDTTTGKWSTLAPMQRGRHGHAAAVRNARIIVTGGYAMAEDESHGQTTDVEVFSQSTNAWTQGPALRSPHAFHGMANVNGTLYAFGTRGDDRSVEKLAPEASAWTNAAPMPAARGRFASALIRNTLYVIDGEDEHGEAKSSILVYDSNANEWSIHDE